ATEPRRDEFGATRPAWRQSRPARADGRLDTVFARMAARRADLHWRFARRARRWRDQPDRARDPHAGGADPGWVAKAEEISVAAGRDGHPLDYPGARQGPQHRDEPRRAQCHRLFV